MQDLPLYVTVTFILTTFFTLYLFARVSFFSRKLFVTVSVWLVAQAVISLTGFYTNTDVLPPRFLLLVVPPLALIILFLIARKGRKVSEGFSIQFLLLLHIVRIPVEIVLYWLYQEGQVPKLMTFEGRNLDILSGLSAPVIYYFFMRGKVSRFVLVFWNVVCLLFLLNIVVHAILSAPFPFQLWAFNQPNVAVFYFPFIWLPGFIVPVVLFSHLVMIRRFLLHKKQDVRKHILSS